MHLKCGPYKFFDAQKNDGREFVVAMRPFSDAFVTPLVGQIKKTWLIDENAGTSQFWGEAQMVNVVNLHGSLFFEFRRV